MKPSPGPASSPLTWVLTLVFVALIDVSITHSSILWRHMSGEDTRDVRWAQVAQTFQAARKLYAPRPSAATRVVLLGDSRVWFAAQEPYVEREIRRLAPDLDVEVDNLAIFGAQIGDLEVLSRHLDRIHPALVVVAVDGLELLPTKAGRFGQWPSEVLNVGWRDGPLPAHGLTDRLDRWLRTIWPLYRFREYARAAIADRFAPQPATRPFPDHFASSAEFHALNHGARGAEIEAAFQRFRDTPTLDTFIAYLKTKRRGFLKRPDLIAPPRVQPRADREGARILDVMLANLARRGLPTIVLLLPQDPLLDADAQGQYHRPEFSDQAAALISATAARYDIPVVDARRWMPPEAFIDFIHLMPDVGGFQTPLAREIVDALRRG